MSSAARGNDNINLNGNTNVIDGQSANNIIDTGGSNDTVIGGSATTP
jgi:hypothetical protein